MDLLFTNYLQLPKRLVVWCCLLVFVLAVPVNAEKIRIAIKVQGTQQEQKVDYFSQLLVMALEASKAENEMIEIIYSSRDYSQRKIMLNQYPLC